MLSQGLRSLLFDASKTIFSCCSPTGVQVAQLEHHRPGRPVLLGAVVARHLQTYNLTKFRDASGVVNSVKALAAASGIQKATESGQLHDIGRGWSNAFMERNGFVVRKENANKLPPSCEEPKESYDIFDCGGEQLAWQSPGIRQTCDWCPSTTGPRQLDAPIRSPSLV